VTLLFPSSLFPGFPAEEEGGLSDFLEDTPEAFSPQSRVENTTLLIRKGDSLVIVSFPWSDEEGGFCGTSRSLWNPYVADPGWPHVFHLSHLLSSRVDEL